MPWDIRSSSDGYCVHRSDTGERVACHNSNQDAVAHLAALYASEDGVKMGGVAVFKGFDGSYYFVASYSNNTRDSDNPPEIITGSSHKSFEQRVLTGELPLPPLWLWHEEDWPIGKSLAVWTQESDGVVYALALGKFDKMAAALAESVLRDPMYWALSHGMINVKREDEDGTIITGHDTIEISLLPRDAAANKLTYILSMENNMTKQQKSAALAEAGVGLPLLDALKDAAAQNEGIAALIKQHGIEFKAEAEVEEQAEEAVAEEVVEEEAAAEATEEEQSESADGDEASEQLVGELTKFAEAVGAEIKTLADVVVALDARIQAIEAADKARIEEQARKAAAETPALSLAAIITGQASTVVGSEKARVDGRTKEAKDGPQETREENGGGVGSQLFFRANKWTNPEVRTHQ